MAPPPTLTPAVREWECDDSSAEFRGVIINLHYACCNLFNLPIFHPDLTELEIRLAIYLIPQIIPSGIFPYDFVDKLIDYVKDHTPDHDLFRQAERELEASESTIAEDVITPPTSTSTL
ncbi:hypothetical protein PAPYR_8299 [Paratrimastix pyriformis]|uniref:Uncharacterized protein n=1 Tax=Paratrimastix pyriformis TaxID=342808 RepID=A0ABQ8UDM9_9EUKA|nr:hypothetical protein PAPYR_8299 [Paratrimastix pyriformis]